MDIIYNGKETNNIKIKLKLLKARKDIEQLEFDIVSAIYNNIDSLKCMKYTNLEAKDIKFACGLCDDGMYLYMDIGNGVIRPKMFLPLDHSCYAILNLVMNKMIIQYTAYKFIKNKYPQLDDYKTIHMALVLQYNHDNYNKDSIIEIADYIDMLYGTSVLNDKNPLELDEILKNELSGENDITSSIEEDVTEMMSTKIFIWEHEYCSLYQVNILKKMLSIMEDYAYRKIKQVCTNYKVIEGKNIEMEEIYNEFKKEIGIK